jgi:hypothetical protein
MLAHDIYMCFDETCEEREECLRWIERQMGARHTPRSESLFPYDVEYGEPCPMKLNVDKKLNGTLDEMIKRLD